MVKNAETICEQEGEETVMGEIRMIYRYVHGGSLPHCGCLTVCLFDRTPRFARDWLITHQRDRKGWPMLVLISSFICDGIYGYLRTKYPFQCFGAIIPCSRSFAIATDHL